MNNIIAGFLQSDRLVWTKEEAEEIIRLLGGDVSKVESMTEMYPQGQLVHWALMYAMTLIAQDINNKEE